MNFTVCRSSQNLKSGDIGLIQSGLFAGYRVIFDIHLPQRERVCVLKKLLQGRQVRMDLSEDQVELLK